MVLCWCVVCAAVAWRCEHTATCWANGGGLAPPATYIRSVDWSFGLGGGWGVGSVSSVLLLAYIDFDVDLSTR